MNLPRLTDLKIKGKRVMVRGDLDVGRKKLQNSKYSKLQVEDLRLISLIPTLKHIYNQKVKKIIIIGHCGRPGGKVVKELSLGPISKVVEKLLNKELGEEKMKKLDMQMMENLRFNKGEEENDIKFAEQLAKLADVYVNEAFSASHREHASIVGIPKLLPHAAGLRFVSEVENLEKVLKEPVRPVIVVLGGVKEDKLNYLEPFKKFADKILVGGRLPDFIDQKFPIFPPSPGFRRAGIFQFSKDKKVIVANLLPDKKDITVRSIEKFEDEIKKAGTIIIAGPMGKFEDIGQQLGTRRILQAVANSSAFKVVGGGDTKSAIDQFGLGEMFDWISVGGGAALEFLAKRTLPGIEALSA